MLYLNKYIVYSFVVVCLFLITLFLLYICKCNGKCKGNGNGKCKGKIINNDPNNNYLLLVSAQCKNYQDWQSFVLYWSAVKNWSSVNYIRLLSCTSPSNYKYTMKVPSFVCSDWGIHPKTGDQYLPYNRPVSIVDYFKSNNPKQEFMVIIDPDTIILKPLDDLGVQKGIPVGQKYDYLYNDDGLNKVAKKLIPQFANRVQPIGMPMIIHRDDLKQLAPLWLKYTEDIRNDVELKDLVTWTAEMHSYCIAAAVLNLKHIMRDDLADRTPYNLVDNPYVLHYDLPHTTEKGFKWNKRDYIRDDLLRSKKLMPIPKDPPTKNFKKVFEMINEGLIKSRKYC